jgi:hypothetical protein
MKLSAYDMYAHSNDASAKNWATMKKDYPNIKVKTKLLLCRSLLFIA